MRKLGSLPLCLTVASTAAILLCALPGKAWAVNLGVQGTVWPIIEIDMRVLIMEQLAKVNWNNIHQQLKKSAKAYLNNLPKRQAPGVRSTRTRWYNPSITLANNIYAPEKGPHGNYHWVILFRKGTTVNPLSKERPTNAMLFFNGHSAAQVAFVKKAVSRFPYQIMPIEATGMSPQPFTLKFHTPVFTETPAMAARFDLRRTPSLLYPGSGVHRLYLGYTTFAPPFSIKALEETWPKELKAEPRIKP